MFCQTCGCNLPDNAAVCSNCGTRFAQPVYAGEQKSKIAAVILGIIFGGLGLHNFYLGYTGRALLQLVLTICSVGIASLWGFIEGILILVGTITHDAKGIPLKD